MTNRTTDNHKGMRDPLDDNKAERPEPRNSILREKRQMTTTPDSDIKAVARSHELTTTEYEGTEYPDVEEGVEAFKELVEEVNTDVLACLVGDDTGCLDPEDVDYDNEAEWTKRKLLSIATAERERGYEQGADFAIERVQQEYLRGQLEERDRCEKIAHNAGDYWNGLDASCISGEAKGAAVSACEGIEEQIRNRGAEEVAGEPV